jgi:actin related protein 2/3 complex, subunit 4
MDKDADASYAAQTREEYGEDIAIALYRNLCLRDFPCQDVERRNKPEIEFATCPELLLPHVVVQRQQSNEACLIEPSINSTRISFRFCHEDGLEEALGNSYYRFLGRNADFLPLLRRRAVDGYHLSFLVTAALLQQLGVMQIVLFLVKIALQMPAYLSDLKCQVRSLNRRLVAYSL